MPPRSVGGIGINECGNCNGIWAPGNRLDLLVNRALEAQKHGETTRSNQPHEPRVKGGNPMSQGVKYRKCPECEAFMQRRNFRRSSGVIIDTCRKHGTWLDADELEQITGFVLSGGNPTAEAMLQDADRQAAEAMRSIRLASVGVGESSWTRSSRARTGSGDFLAGTIVSVLKGLLE